MPFMPRPALLKDQVTRSLTRDTWFLCGLRHAVIEGLCFSVRDPCPPNCKPRQRTNRKAIHQRSSDKKTEQNMAPRRHHSMKESLFHLMFRNGCAVTRWKVWLEITTSNFFFQLNTCSYSPFVTFSLLRGWVCRLQLLLVLASAVILRSEPRGTHDHILLSQIRDSPNLEGQIPIFISPRHWVPFSSPHMTRKATVEVFEPTYTRDFSSHSLN
jgi:hypothetical protein